MMRTILKLLLLLPCLVTGEPGPTASFEQRNQAAREQLAKVLPDGRAQIQWSRSGEDWWVSLQPQNQEKIVGKISGENFARGKVGDVAWEESVRPDRKKSENLPQPGSLDESIFGELKTDGGKLRFGDTEFQAPEGWIWDERPTASAGQEWFVLSRIKDIRLREVNYVRSSPSDQLQPKFFRNTYPKPGDELRDRVPVVFGADGSKVEVEPAFIENPYSISRVHWRSENRLWFEYIERGFGAFRLLELNAETGVTRIVAEEKSDKFVHVFEKCAWWDLGEGNLLWRSEEDGWSHLYRVDEGSGERTQLTKGEWVVRGVNRIEGDEVYFQLSGFYPGQDPYYLHYAKLNWRTGELTLLTHGDGTYDLFWSPDRSYYVCRYSRVDLPPVYELRDGKDGRLVFELWRTPDSELKQASPFLPERFVTTDREGRYSIHGVIWKPADFDPHQTYPVIENIYAGPQGAFVPKGWQNWYWHKSELAAAGFVVVQIDGRGTNFRGREFQQFAYKNIKDSGFPDRIKWIREAARTRPWMDVKRVGLYGGSAGGQSTLAGLLWHGDFYRAGAADCGCHDNRMDKIWWNEQWMDWPVDDSYRANSNTEHVAQLKGDFFLTVGEVDTNVDPSSTYQVVDALIRADKNFEYYAVPNGGHGVGEKPYLRRKRLEFFQRSLGQ